MPSRITKRDLLGLVPIDLPIAVPSIPVLAPVLTNLVHGDNAAAPSPTHHSTTPINTPSIPPTPTWEPAPTTPIANPSPNPSPTSQPQSTQQSQPEPQPQPQPEPADPSIPSVTVGNSISIAAPSVIVSMSGTGSDAVPVTFTVPGSLPSNIQNAAVQPSATGNSAGGQGANGGPNGVDSAGLPNVTAGSNPNQSSIPGSPSNPSNPSGSIVAHPGSPSDPSALSHHKGFPSYAIGLLATVGVIAGLFLALFLIRKRNIGRREARRTLWLPVMAEAANGLPSARSSFATNFDHGLRAPSPDNNIPSLPPPVVVASRASSDSLDAQYLFVDHPSTNGTPTGDSTGPPPLPSPMSVRPFSPTESYRFPRPPSHAATSPPTNASGITLIDLDDSPQPLQDLPPIPAIAKSSELIEVKRPFAPSLADELYIEPGEFVQILDAFDDGWALIAKPNGLKGLAPLACFEETDQDVDIPAFLAAHKRRSSMANFGVAC